jgi:aminopeptidase N
VVVLLAMATWGCACAGVGAEAAPIERGQNPPPGPYAPGFDVQHYDIELDLLGAQTDPAIISGTTTIDVRMVEPLADSLRLDFTGLRVLSVQASRGDGAVAGAAYRYAGGKLVVAVPAGTGAALRVRVSYDGTPDDGLIIRENVHGARSAFVDNWPNRARFWFPSIDHPSDKATMSLAVRVPDGWQVVSNAPRTGVAGFIQASPAADGWWRFETTQPIPTYTMVFGAAVFDVRTIDGCAFGHTEDETSSCVPVTSWVFPEDTAAGARNFRRAARMMEVFSELIAPFPYEKLAHVQSATEFGGMENAGAIFYSEQALAQNRDIEGTVAHETAHQWFGDAVTQSDWQHLWLSEGFADYFEAIFFEREDGVDAFRAKMDANAAAYLGSDVTDLPIVDTTATLLPDLFALLNQNSYQKGSWVLHMLRGRLGDDAFFRGIRAFYRAHEFGNALTPDLQAALEEASGADLDDFFDQWVYSPGYPILRVSHEYEAARDRLRIRVEQTQKATWPVFTGPLQVDIVTTSGTRRETIQLTARVTVAETTLSAAPTELRVDPDGWLLHTTEP